MRHLLATLLLAISAHAHALFVVEPGKLVDTATGLEWAGLGFSRGFTWGQMLDGYRYATGAEVAELFADAGIVFDPVDGFSQPVTDLLRMWGSLHAEGSKGGYGSTFWLADAGQPGFHHVGSLEQFWSVSGGHATGWVADPFGTEFADAVGGIDRGAALVREASPVPEPATWFLMALGLLYVKLRLRISTSLP